MTERRNRTDKPEPPSNTTGKILSFIRERRYQPSERLPSERDFAEKFDTSRGAVREALAALEAMRIIERRPNSGIYLRNSDESSIEASSFMPSQAFLFRPKKSPMSLKCGAYSKYKPLDWPAPAGRPIISEILAKS